MHATERFARASRCEGPRAGSSSRGQTPRAPHIARNGNTCRRPVWIQSDAIRRNQRSSAVISGPVWIQSDAIRRNQRSSVVISGPVWIQSDAIRRNQTQSDAIRRNQTQSDAITHLFGCIARRRSVAIRKGQARGVTRGKVRGAPARMHRIALRSQAAGTRSRPREIYRPPTWARMHRRRPRWAYAPC